MSQRPEKEAFMKYLLFFGLISLLSACATPPHITMRGKVMSQVDLEQGQKIYVQYCASCHGANGEGQFPDAPREPDATGRRGAPPHTSEGHTWHHGDELLIAYVRDGGMGDPESFYPMPAFGDQLSETDIIQVIGYIKTMWGDEQRAYQDRATASESNN
jgi:mono/diheme cytochrome c family protein